MGDLNKLPSVEETTQPVSLDETKLQNQEITEIIVKPGPCGYLKIINGNVSNGIYKVFNAENEFCEVNNSELAMNLKGFKKEDVSGVADVKWDSSVPFSEKRVNDDHGGYVEKKEVSGVSSLVFGKDFEKCRLVDMDGIIELDNGNFLINSYGKYQPNLSFINKSPEVRFVAESKETFNLPEGRFSVIYGDFFTSKKGTKCFRILPKEKAKHILICDNWGGAFNKYRGETLPEDEAVYYRRASSNGGGSGNDYGIYPKDWKYRLSEEDI